MKGARARIAAVSFDAGFTLIEPRTSIEATYRRVARELGAEVEDERFAAHLRASWQRVDRAFRSRHPTLRTSERMEREAWRAFTREVATPFPGLLERHEDWHRRLVAHFDAPESWRVLDGVEELLDGLDARGLPLAVTSNWHGALHAILEALALRSRFRVVLTSAEVGRKKPHAGIFRALRRALEEPRGRLLHVGDSWNDDVLGARRHGLEPVWFAPHGAEAPDAGATVIRRPGELLRHLD